MSIEPYSAVLLGSYGGPDKSEDVLPFMRNATAGKNIPDERLVEVSKHYEMFGGKSPINELNAALIAALRDELAGRGIDVPVVIGNRNWHPFMRDTVQELADAGHARVVGLATSAYCSYSSCRQYHEDFERGSEGLDIRIDKVDPYAETPEFAAANARLLVDAYRRLRDRVGEGVLRVLFVTHSIPLAMNEASSDGRPENRYEAQHHRVAQAVADLARVEIGEDFEWDMTYCSRSGPPHIPWLEPDLNDHMETLPERGVAGAVAAPIGFIADHMEVVYDLDTEGRQTAAQLGLAYERAATVGTDPGFVKLLADKLLEQAEIARGERPPSHHCEDGDWRCSPIRPAGSPTHHPHHKEHQHGEASRT